MTTTSTIQGLSQAEAAERRARGLGNNSKIQTSRSYGQILRENVFTFINNILFGLGIALVLVGRTSDALVSVGIVSINIVVSVVQEVRAKKMLDRIALLTRPSATVVRENEELTVDPSELVVGDILLVKPGDQIVLDGQVVDGTMEVDESLLTGESDLIPKTAGIDVLSGSFCVTGMAYYEAQKVGNESYANRLTSEAKTYRRMLTPIQQETNLVIRILLLIAVYIEFMLVVRDVMSQVAIAESVQIAVVVAGLVPNGLFVAIALAYAMGAVRIAGKGALVQQSNAVESLSNVDVLCMDKTGTLTANQIRFHALCPLGDVSEAELRRRLGIFTASSLVGNRTSEAIAIACPGDRVTPVEEVPFSSERKWSALSFASPEINGAYALGAIEMLSPALKPGSEMNGKVVSWENEGLRVLLFAYLPEPRSFFGDGHHPQLPKEMLPLGLIALSDVLRPEVDHTLAGFRQAGVKLKVISGDNPQTVAAIARRAGLGPDLVTVSGLELEEMSEAEFADAAETCTIFGRITPRQKERLVQALRKRGHYAAMIGDGVNDVLSLKQSNLGIAMQSGSQAARLVADIVLLGDSFASLPFAVREGQRIINGMHDILRLFLARTFFVALLVISISILGPFFPLSPKQSSILALLAVGLPTMALAIWARPGPTEKGNLVRRLLHFVLPTSLTVSIFGLLVFVAFMFIGFQNYLLLHPEVDDATALGNVLPMAQTALTSFTILCGLMLLVFVEPPSKFWEGAEKYSGDRRPTYLAIGLLVLYIVFISIPSLRSSFDFIQLTLWQNLAIAGAVILCALVLRWTWRSHLVGRYFSIDFDSKPG
jgi:cation-transporting ATPase E